MYSSGPVTPTHTETIRPWLSKVIEPQSWLSSEDSVFGERPSGPPQL